MSKKVESKSWNEFIHILSGHGYSSTERSVLYQKYKAEIIIEKELANPELLDKYLSVLPSKTTGEVKPSKIKVKTYGLDISNMKSRLISFVKALDTKHLPQNIIDYTNDIYSYTLEDEIEYIQKIKDDLDDEIDYIVEETEKLRDKIKEFQKFGDIEGGTLQFMTTLVLLGELEIASKLYEELVKTGDKDAIHDSYIMYKHFTPWFEKNNIGEMEKLRKRLTKNSKKIDPHHLSSNIVKFICNGSFHNLSGFKEGLTKIKNNPKVEIDKLIKDYIYLKIEPPYPYGNEQVLALDYLLVLDEFDIVYDIYKKLAKTSNSYVMYYLYKYFTPQYIKKVGPNAKIDIYRQLIQAKLLKNILSKDEIIEMVTYYNSSNQKLETKVEQLEQENLKLKDEVLNLTYRPGGPGFERAQGRQTGKYGIKK